MTTMSVSGWMFLLVPAHPGCSRQIPQSRKTVVWWCVCVLYCLLVLHIVCDHGLCFGQFGIVHHLSHEQSYSPLSPVSTGMGDHLRADKPPRYVTKPTMYHVNLALHPSMIAKLSTTFNWLGYWWEYHLCSWHITLWSYILCELPYHWDVICYICLPCVRFMTAKISVCCLQSIHMCIFV